MLHIISAKQRLFNVAALMATGGYSKCGLLLKLEEFLGQWISYFVKNKQKSSECFFFF